MKMADLIRVCKAAIPAEIAWTPNEPYGEYNIDDMNKTVKKVLYCVTATKEVREYFRKGEYDLLISHHPIITDLPQLIFHTALDCCDGGLNDQWRDHLGMLKGYSHFDGTLGWFGEIEPIEFEDLVAKVKQLSGKVDGQLYLESMGDRTIRSIVVCSGLGGLVVDQAFETGVDCYILGENIHSAESTGFRALIETGHTASEWIGVLLFRKLLPDVQVDLAPSDLDVFGRETFRPRKRDLWAPDETLWVPEVTSSYKFTESDEDEVP